MSMSIHEVLEAAADNLVTAPAQTLRADLESLPNVLSLDREGKIAVSEKAIRELNLTEKQTRGATSIANHIQKLASSGDIQVSTDDSGVTVTLAMTAPAVASGHGRATCTTHWWGFTVEINEKALAFLEEVIATGTAVAAALAALGIGSAVAAIIAVALAGLLSGLKKLDHHNGVWFSFLWVGVPCGWGAL